MHPVVVPVNEPRPDQNEGQIADRQPEAGTASRTGVGEETQRQLGRGATLHKVGRGGVAGGHVGAVGNP